jgi:probable blue pigment (indigoidine) exporter
MQLTIFVLMNVQSTNRVQTIAAGIGFAILWASAATATKVGLQYAQPFMIAVPRFFLAGCIMLFIAHILLKQRLPLHREWIQISIYGLLNVSVYLGLYVMAMKQVSAGLAALSIATNPVFISILSAVWMQQKISTKTIMSLLLCSLGILIAAYPLLQNSYATPSGVMLLILSMLAYSVGAVYFSKNRWNDLHMLVINGWQTLIGGILLVPFLFFFYQQEKNIFNLTLGGAIIWLAIPVSIGAVQLWLFLLKNNPVKASFWLFLCPVFGFIIAATMLKEPISFFTVCGVALVITGLYIVQKKT